MKNAPQKSQSPHPNTSHIMVIFITFGALLWLVAIILNGHVVQCLATFIEHSIHAFPFPCDDTCCCHEYLWCWNSVYGSGHPSAAQATSVKSLALQLGWRNCHQFCTAFRGGLRFLPGQDQNSKLVSDISMPFKGWKVRNMQQEEITHPAQIMPRFLYFQDYRFCSLWPLWNF